MEILYQAELRGEGIQKARFQVGLQQIRTTMEICLVGEEEREREREKGVGNARKKRKMKGERMERRKEEEGEIERKRVDGRRRGGRE